MIYRIYILSVLLYICKSFAANVDSSDIIFDDSKIHHYEIQFYYDNWEDSLKYYKSLPDEEYIPGRVIYRMPSGDSILLDSIGVRYKGNSSYTFAANSAKKPFKFNFGKYRDEQRFFGVKRLNFTNGAKDPTMMREKIVYDIIGQYMPAARAAFATITIHGRLIGLYTQVEQIDKSFLRNHFKDNDFNLYKSSDNGSSLLYKGPNQADYETNYELKTNETVNDWSGLISMIEKLNNTSDADFVPVVGGCLALDNICRYLAFNMAISNFDSYSGSGRNFYLYDDSITGLFTLIPWDLNLSFGVYTNSWDVTIADVINITNLDQRPLNRRILENDSLCQVYLRYIKSMIEGPASSDSIAAKVDRFKPFLDSLVQADSNKLHTYAEFVKNCDSNVIILDGLARTTVPGLTLFSRARNAALQTQLENYVPIIWTNNSQRTQIRNFNCFSGVSNRKTIQYTVKGSAASVYITIYTVQGTLVHSFSEGKKSPGTYYCYWDTRSLSAGYYLLKLTTGIRTSTIGIIVPN